MGLAPLPLPLLGTFHEISIATEDVRAAVEFYERLGFTQAPTTDTYTHLYGVLTDGRAVIGLHRRAGPSPVLTFVQPGIARRLGHFGTAGLQLASCRTGDEAFNEVSFADPGGHTVAVLEARTYSPGARAATETSWCGDFAHVSLPARDFAAAQSFWEPLGFVAEELFSPYPHLALTSDYLDLAFHAPQLCRQAMLVFRDPDMAARIERLREHNVPLTAGPVPQSAWLRSPDGTALLLRPEEVG
jgi:catechol 2,3-dioxygenase-like lactoylglutathione lyase family enzyme